MIMHYFLVIISLVLSAAPVFADSPFISWDDLLPGEAVRFDEPFEKTDPASKRVLLGALIGPVPGYCVYRYSLVDGMTVRVDVEGASANVVVKVDENIPAGFALVPRSMGVAIEKPAPIKIQVAETLTA